MSYASGNASAPAAAPILDPNASNIPSWVFTNSQVAVDTLGLALIALAVFSLGSLPRVIPRLYHRTSWADGWVLRWYDPTRPAIVRQSVFQRMTPVPPRRSTLKREDFLQGTEMKHLTPSISEKSDASSSKISRSDTVHSRLGAQQILPPVHFPSWSSLLHPVSTWLAFPNFGLSRGALTILIIYALWNIIFLFIFSNVVTNLKRAGFISVAQYPIAFALGSKNSLVGLLVGRSYEKLNYLHRWVGRIMYGACVFHVVGYLVLWTKYGILTEQMKLTQRNWATTAFGAMSVCALLSLPIIRRNMYTVFYHSHWVGFAVMLLATVYHVKSTLPYVLSCLFIYLIDMSVRFWKSHRTTATIYAMPQLGTTLLEIPNLSSGWRAGQHVRIRVLSTKMGWLGWSEPHPFTIASIPTMRKGGALQLYIKKAGDWTTALYDLAATHQGDPENPEGKGKGKEGMGIGKTVQVVVEGPYGGTGNAIVSSFSSSLIVVAGSGVTFALATIRDLIKNGARGSSRVRILELVWVVQDSRSVIPLLPTFASLISQADYIPSLEFTISIYFTRAPSALDTAMPFTVPSNLTVNSGRPDLRTISKDIVARTAELKTGGSHGVLVASCGPLALNRDVRKAAAGSCSDKSIREAIGGIEIHEEAFSW